MAQTQQTISGSVAVAELAEQTPSVQIGHNMPPTVERALLADMTENYKPGYENVNAATVALATATGALNVAENQIRANRRSAVRVILADLAFFAAREGKFDLNANADTSFARWLRETDNLALKTSEIGSRSGIGELEDGKQIAVQVDTVNLLDTITQTDRRAALLYALGHLSGVCLGCLPKSSKKRVNFTAGDPFEPLGDKTRRELDGTHFIAICAPVNRIWPYRFVRITEGNKPAQLRWIMKDDKPEPYTNEALVYLNDGWINALFSNLFAGRPFTFDMEGDNATGAINGVEQRTVGRASNAGNENAPGNVTLQSVIERQKSEGLGGLMLLASTVTHDPMPAWANALGVPAPAEAAVWIASAALGMMLNLKRQHIIAPTKRFADGKLAATLCELRNELVGCISDERGNGDHYVTDENEKDIFRITGEALHAPPKGELVQTSDEEEEESPESDKAPSEQA